MADVKQRLLREAANLVGKEELAKHLSVPVTLLDAWLRGLATMPDRSAGIKTLRRVLPRTAP
jgi:hypothetical protein